MGRFNYKDVQNKTLTIKTNERKEFVKKSYKNSQVVL